MAARNRAGKALSTTNSEQTIGGGGARPEIEVPAYDRRGSFEERLAAQAKRLTKRRAQRALRVFLGTIGWLTHGRAPYPPLRSGDPAVKRILVVRVDLLGDVVLSLPAVRVLRRTYPHAQIDMLVLRSTAAILKGEREDIARVLEYDPHIWRRPATLLHAQAWRDALALLHTLRDARYDLCVSISGDIGSILSRLTGARRRVGYAAEAYPFFLTDQLPGGRYRQYQHEVRYVLALAERAGGAVLPGDEELSLHVLPEVRRTAQWLVRDARKRTGAQGPIVAMHVGARNGQAKRWPPQHFAALAARLVEEHEALVLLTGALSETALAEEILSQTCARVVNLVGKTSVPELVALLAESDVLVTGDSGPMHIACAVRTPVVALHGPTDPALSGPTARDAIVLRQRLWCAPCYDASATAECRFGNPVCMKQLRPELVLAAVHTQLRRAQSATVTG